MNMNHCKMIKPTGNEQPKNSLTHQLIHKKQSGTITPMTTATTSRGHKNKVKEYKNEQ